MPEITVKIVSQYGNKRIFPVCQTAMQFTRIKQSNCLTKEDIDCIKELGFTVKVESATL